MFAENEQILNLSNILFSDFMEDLAYLPQSHEVSF